MERYTNYYKCELVNQKNSDFDVKKWLQSDVFEIGYRRSKKESQTEIDRCANRLETRIKYRTA